MFLNTSSLRAGAHARVCVCVCVWVGVFFYRKTCFNVHIERFLLGGGI